MDSIFLPNSELDDLVLCTDWAWSKCKELVSAPLDQSCSRALAPMVWDRLALLFR